MLQVRPPIPSDLKDPTRARATQNLWMCLGKTFFLLFPSSSFSVLCIL